MSIFQKGLQNLVKKMVTIKNYGVTTKHNALFVP